jgi:hypothetical protein
MTQHTITKQHDSLCTRESTTRIYVAYLQDEVKGEQLERAICLHATLARHLPRLQVTRHQRLQEAQRSAA